MGCGQLFGLGYQAADLVNMPSMPEKRYLNLVFQGGGVRGIAYAGVLDKMPPYCEIHATGGTSAGAIVAGLLAIGKRGAELREILLDKELYGLLDAEETRRFNRISKALTELGTLLSPGRQGWRFAARLWRWKGRHEDALSDAAAVWNARGFYRSDKLRGWLDRVFEKKTFDQIKLADLRIVVSDVSLQDYVVYTKRTHPGELIATAVHASANIPLFFTPYLNGTRHLVDGGLLSNYPSFLFAQGGYPTIGFRLADITPGGPIHDTPGYLKSLLLTMAEAHDKQRPVPKRFRSYVIATPEDLPATKFDLTPDDANRLFKAGQKVGEAVEWAEYSSPTPHIAFYDPSPDDALELSMSQARELRDRYYEKDQHVESLHQVMEFEVRIEMDWTTLYYRTATLQVRGSKPLVMSRMGAVGNAELGRLIPSLVDVRMICEEITPGKPVVPMIRLPVENGETKKGFIVFYTPPISEADGARKFLTGFTVPQEFAHTVAMGREDVASYSVVQQAVNHNLDLTFRVLVDSDLPELSVLPDFGGNMEEERIFDDKKVGRVYRCYSCSIANVQIRPANEFRVRIKKRVGNLRWGI